MITYNSSIVLVNELIFFLVFACLSLAIAVTPCSIIFRWQIRQGLTAILIGWFLLFGLWYSAFYLQQDSNFLILILGVIFLGDTAAYLFGKKFGKNKMLPSVSPGKTWEGFLGSIVVALMFCLLLSVSLSHSLSVVDIAFLGCISIILIILGVMGDLFISLVKRQNGKKDTGIILPGHGGILDRVDSMIFSLPFSFLLVSGISW